ncbi:adenylate kinase [bacterium]|nr:adenylate kinase [bacterium]
MIKNIIILGPQGSGKGTQAKLLADKFKLEHIETGSALRGIKKEDTELGRKVAQIIDAGKLVPSPIIAEIIGNKVKTVSKNKGVVFDGIPRTLDQSKSLEKILKKNGRHITHVFFIQISEKESISRLSKRYICGQCGKLFIIEKSAVNKFKKCPKCGGNIIRRKDDTPAGIKQRLKLYKEMTFPVVEYYRQKQKLIEINGEQPIEKVFNNIKSFL